jgi:hypothetical protein
MNRKDVLIAKLKAKQRVREAVMNHKKKFSPPAPPQQQPMTQEQPNAGTPTTLPAAETQTDQPI